MTANQHREAAKEASIRAQRRVKEETAALDLLREAVDGYRNQPKAWNPEYWVNRAELLLEGK